MPNPEPTRYQRLKARILAAAYGLEDPHADFKRPGIGGQPTMPDGRPGPETWRRLQDERAEVPPMAPMTHRHIHVDVPTKAYLSAVQKLLDAEAQKRLEREVELQGILARLHQPEEEPEQHHRMVMAHEVEKCSCGGWSWLGDPQSAHQSYRHHILVDVLELSEEEAATYTVEGPTEAPDWATPQEAEDRAEAILRRFPAGELEAFTGRQGFRRRAGMAEGFQPHDVYRTNMGRGLLLKCSCGGWESEGYTLSTAELHSFRDHLREAWGC